jgi:hypothetical protein
VSLGLDFVRISENGGAESRARSTILAIIIEITLSLPDRGLMSGAGGKFISNENDALGSDNGAVSAVSVSGSELLDFRREQVTEVGSLFFMRWLLL